MDESETEPSFDPPLRRALLGLWRGLSGPPPSQGTPTYALTRTLFLRGLGLIYLVAFTIAWNQGRGLLGEHGLLPMADFLAEVKASHASTWESFVALPTVFWWDHSDGFFVAIASCGVALSVAVILGVTNAVVMFVLWALYLSIDHVGQRWYAFGWENQLLETGMLAVFLAPIRGWRPFASPVPKVPIFLLRWLIVRIMFGAGLIKLRGDPCWSDLTCLYFHFETQPVPNPLSPLFHHAPAWALRAGVAFNHFVELLVPVFAFGPRRARHVAGGLMIAFQLTLIASGNLSFLNWLTILPCLACFDDDALRHVVSRRVARRAEALGLRQPSRMQRWTTYVFAGVVAWSSLPVLANLAGRRQAMNRSFDRLHLVNTYGAFGTVGRERYELVIEGTHDLEPGDDASWLAYAFACKPGDPTRRPCLVSPYHYRLDWLMWFAALEVEGTGRLQREDWVLRLVHAFLRAEPAVLELIEHDPFGGRPPRFVRVSFYRYELAPIGAREWWHRTRLGTLIRPLAVDDPAWLTFLHRRG